MKNIEVVGEAAYMLTKAFKKAHPEIPWKVVQGMRHVLVHDYANVVSATLYDTAVNDMIPLHQQIERKVVRIFIKKKNDEVSLRISNLRIGG